MRCIITGCALVDGETWIAGDLFECEGALVFHGNIDRSTGLPKQFPLELCHYERRLEPTNWWQRRGVFVMSASDANLNEVARTYIRGDES